MRRWLLAAALVLCSACAFADTQYYRSNDFGMLLERIPSYLKDQNEWVLQIQRDGGSEVRRLLQDGKEKHRWETTSGGKQRVERELVAGELVAVRIYSLTGELTDEEQYDKSGLTQKTRYTYGGGRLARTQAFDPDGALKWTEDYLYATNGSLREVRKTPATGSPSVSRFVSGPSGVSEERDSANGTVRVVRYDRLGRPIERVLSNADGVSATEDLTYRGDSDTLSDSVEELSQQKQTVSRSFDDKGRLLTETTKAGPAVVEQVTYVRDDKGDVITKRRVSSAGQEVWNYTLAADGSVAKEQYLRRGVLQKITLYGTGATRTEELYQDGLLFLKVFYEGDNRVKEELYDHGRLLRTRTFP